MTRLEPLDGAPLTLGSAAVRVDGRREGPAELALTGIAPVDEAGESDLAFLAARRYARYAGASPAAAFLVSEELESTVAGRPRIVVKDPHRALVLLLEAVAPRPLAIPGVHPTAVLGTGVRLGDGVTVGPYAVLGEGVRVGEGCRIGAHAVVGDGAHLGEDVVLHPHVVIYPDTRVGSRSILHAGAVMGADGFGYVFEDGAHRRIPHLGRAVIEDDVEIGANTCVDRGSIGDTVVGAGTKMDNLVHIAHNVRVGARSLLAAMVGIAGSTRVGQGVMFGGQSGVVNHREIGDGARLAAAAKVMRDVAPGETVSGHPARPHREDLHRQAHLGRLPALADRVRALEAAMRALQGKSD